MSFRFTPDQIAFFSRSDYAQIRDEIADEVIKYGDSPRLQTNLRKRYPHLEPGLLSGAIEQLILAPRIAEKTGLQPGSIATRDLLEQASSAATARYHAELFTPKDHVLECCAGMGADTIAIARRVRHVTAVEADAVHAAILHHNITVAGLANVTVLHCTAEEALTDNGNYTAIFADPSRRTGGRRTITPEEYRPPLSFFLDGGHGIPTVIKTAPATEITASIPRTYIGAAGECKEQLLLMHFPSTQPLVVDADTSTEWSPGETTGPGTQKWKYLIEPHNAVIASGAVGQYFSDIGCIPVDEAIAYGVCESEPEQSGLHTAFRVLKHFPFSMKAVQQAVSELGFNRSTEIKKRGFPMRPEEVYKKITFVEGGVRGTILLMRVGNGHEAVCAERIG